MVYRDQKNITKHDYKETWIAQNTTSLASAQNSVNFNITISELYNWTNNQDSHTHAAFLILVNTGC